MVKVRIADIIVKDRKRGADDITKHVESIKEAGLLHPILVQADLTLICGLHRLEACKSLGWEYIEATITDLDDIHAELAEIDENLIRNELVYLEKCDQIERRKEIYEILHPETRKGNAQARGMNQAIGNNVSATVALTFTEDLMDKTGLSKRSIETSVQCSKAFTPEQKEILKQAQISQRDTIQLARLKEEQRRTIIDEINKEKGSEILKTLSERSPSAALIHINKQKKMEEVQRIEQSEVVTPTGKYQCLVVDPPWPMQKSERDVRPEQAGFDYPTMSKEELEAFRLADFAYPDCHLYLWTTHKFLPMALHLAAHWGFNYQCQMTWVKNVGFTPFSWMYSTEHVLFCTRGNLPLLALGKRLDFAEPRREHSRKPDVFYDLVRQVSPGPRLDIFSREKREGFDQYGNETAKFAVLDDAV